MTRAAMKIVARMIEVEIAGQIVRRAPLLPYLKTKLFCRVNRWQSIAAARSLLRLLRLSGTNPRSGNPISIPRRLVL